MDKKNEARKKYLKFQSLSREEKKIIDKDFRSEEFIHFKKEDNEPLLIADKYSAASTYSLIRERIYPGKALWKRWAVAASVFILLGLGSTLFLHYSFWRTVTVATGYGEIKEIVLPDQSVVRLNALSSVSYPVRFSKKDRNITLSGEAFFEVTKNKEKPFRVFAGNFYVEVLGTSFNIQSYDNEDIQETALFEGLVALHYGDRQQVLNPGQIAFYDKSNKTLTLAEESLSSVWQWQNNVLVFDDISLNRILRILERNYNVSFDIEDTTSAEVRFNARFSKDKSLSEILDVLSSTNRFTYSRQGNKYVIHPKERIKALSLN